MCYRNICYLYFLKYKNKYSLKSNRKYLTRSKELKEVRDVTCHPENI